MIPRRSSVRLCRASEAFTLVELLVVIAIVGILAAIVIPVAGNARRQSVVAKVTSNLRQTGTLIMLYAVDHRDELPGRNDGSTAGIGQGGKGLNAGATDLIGKSDYVQLGLYLADYAGVELPSAGRVALPTLGDPLGRAASQSPDGTPVLWLLNRDMKRGAAFYPNLTETVIHPFGSNVGEGVPPMRYRALISQIDPARTWSMVQSDVRGATQDYSLSAGSAYNSPLEPVLGTYRLALFFDGSVGRIPVGTDLKKPINRSF